MAAGTAISWAHDTFNPWEGCTRVSPGCANCYAADRAHRFGNDHLWSGQLRRTSAAYWRAPLKWNREAQVSGEQRRVFCASLCDVFDKRAPREWRLDLAQLIIRTPHLTWLLLTKRIGNAAAMLREMFPQGVPANVWLGATVVNQEEAGRDVVKLLATKAALGIRVAFLSIEPMLGRIYLTRIVIGEGDVDQSQPHAEGLKRVRFTINALAGVKSFGWSAVDWVIAGGESGPNARPMHPDWVRSLHYECAGAGVPFHFKQWGEWAPEALAGRDWWGEDAFHEWEGDGLAVARVGKKAAGRLLDGVLHDAVPA